VRLAVPFIALFCALLSACTNGVAPEHPSVLPAEMEGYRLRPGEPLADLAGATALELLVLHPYPYSEEGRPQGPAEDFHEYKVLSRAELTLADDERHGSTIAQTVALLQKSMRENSTTVAACFNPRHGLRFATGDGPVDLVICFECLQFHRHDPDGGQSGSRLSSNHQGALDALFAAHGLTKHPE
jgi:hypothetical protein